MIAAPNGLAPDDEHPVLAYTHRTLSVARNRPQLITDPDKQPLPLEEGATFSSTPDT